MRGMTRRLWLAAAAGGRAFAAPQSRKGIPVDTLPEVERKKKLKVVFVGAHVDDWVDCAGTIARYTALGHEALCMSFTPGDSRSMADMNHMPIEELAAARRDQAAKGASIIGARLKFLDQNNQRMHVDPDAYDAFNKTLAAEQPDVVFTMWPLEFHPDHRAAANLAFNAWLQSGMKFQLYFCETPGGTEMQPQQFIPNRRVDVESVADLKRESFVANAFIKHSWPETDLWARFRGMEYGCKYAEAFVHMATVATMPPENIYPKRWYYGGLRLGHDY